MGPKSEFCIMCGGQHGPEGHYPQALIECATQALNALDAHRCSFPDPGDWCDWCRKAVDPNTVRAQAVYDAILTERTP